MMTKQLEPLRESREAILNTQHDFQPPYFPPPHHPFNHAYNTNHSNFQSFNSPNSILPIPPPNIHFYNYPSSNHLNYPLCPQSFHQPHQTTYNSFYYTNSYQYIPSNSAKTPTTLTNDLITFPHRDLYTTSDAKLFLTPTSLHNEVDSHKNFQRTCSKTHFLTPNVEGSNPGDCSFKVIHQNPLTVPFNNTPCYPPHGDLNEDFQVT